MFASIHPSRRKKILLLIFGVMLLAGLTIVTYLGLRYRAKMQVLHLGFMAYEKRIEWIEDEIKLMHTPGHVVLFGDSIMQWWTFYPDQWPGDKWVNRGVNGDRSTEVLVRLEKYLQAAKPGTVVWSGGLNDYWKLSEKEAPEAEDRIVSSALAATALCRERGIEILVVSVSPVITMRLHPTPWPRGSLQESIRRANKKLKAACRERGIPFLDMHERLLEEGEPNGDLYCYDGVHQREAAYALWKEAIESELQKLSRAESPAILPTPVPARPSAGD